MPRATVWRRKLTTRDNDIMFASDRDDCARMLGPIVYQAVRDCVVPNVGRIDRQSAEWFLFADDGLARLNRLMPDRLFNINRLRRFVEHCRVEAAKIAAQKKPVHENLIVGLARKWSELESSGLPWL
jgi:hypothetical protein